MTIPSRERWEEVSPYLDRAMEMSEEERGAWLVSLRARDPALARGLETLLRERSALSREGFLEEGAPRPSVPATLAGQIFGAYTLVSRIGQGGMGSVWLARRSDGRFEGKAAVKLLNASLVGRSGEERFRREGSILARLTHPHIARLVDAGVSPSGQPYLVLEHVDGEPIDHFCDVHGLSVQERLRLFLDVLAAVSHAHANLIVHRDIKPSNVLVGTDGRVKLLDFGIAKLLEGEAEGGEATALTKEGGRALTPEYAAPEQVTGGPVTTATDVYSLGVLLYLLLTGRHPAEESLKSPADLLRSIVDTEPPRISDSVSTRTRTRETRTENAARRGTTPEGLQRTLKGDLDIIVARALKKRPEERYPSVTALADDILRYLNDEPIGARRDTLSYRAAKFLRRHTAGVAAGTVVVLLLAAVVGFYTMRLAKERDRARLEAEKATKVSDLLTELLTGADPFASREVKEPTLRGILDAGAERFHKELAGQPELKVEMLTLMGRVYHRLDQDEKARGLLEEALATGRRALGPESVRVAQTLNELGVLLRERGDLAASEKVLTECLAMRRRLLGNEHKDVAVTLVELATVYENQGLDEKAEPLLRESLAIRRKVVDEDAEHEVAVSLNDLAHVLRRRGDLAGAESLFRQALPIFQKTRGEEHPHVATVLNNLALVAADREDYAAAESLFRHSLAMDVKILGVKHPNVGNKLINLSRALLEQGKFDDAVSVVQEGLQITRSSLGDDHPRIADGEICLARVRLARGDPASAEPLLRDAVRIRLRVFPPNDWRSGVPKSALGAALTALGRYEEAEPLLLDAQRVLKNIPGAQGQEARATATRLAALYEARGRREKARPYQASAMQR